jgi:ADP-ribosyl-[dinitrogen reductase] hydrolase
MFGVEWWQGCLLGGAVGDALGAPVEFLSLDAIRECFGPAGITELVPYEGRVGAITDDTQMTLFTAEGLLGAARREHSYGIASYEQALYYSYLRWLATQGEQPPAMPQRPVELRGLLYECADLHHRRAPGATCLAALRGGTPGTIQTPLNHSKGCGGVMRAAPAAAFGGFRAGAAVAAITHGHPTGYLAAAALAEMLAQLGAGHDLVDGIAAALDRLAQERYGAQTAQALGRARDLAHRGESSEPSEPETVERLGAGWIAEEALAIATFAALRADGDAVRGITLAVNHSGDSDSTGAIAGNLVGAMLGQSALPAAWLQQLEAREAIMQVAKDLAESPPSDADRVEHGRRYPYC